MEGSFNDISRPGWDLGFTSPEVGVLHLQTWKFAFDKNSDIYIYFTYFCKTGKQNTEGGTKSKKMLTIVMIALDSSHLRFWYEKKANVIITSAKC